MSWIRASLPDPESFYPYEPSSVSLERASAASGEAQAAREANRIDEVADAIREASRPADEGTKVKGSRDW